MTFEGYVIFVRYFGNGDKVSIFVLVRKLGWKFIGGSVRQLSLKRLFRSNSPFLSLDLRVT